MSEILSENVLIQNSVKISTEYIEEVLTSKFNNILRWAIVKIENDKLKICVTYEKAPD